MRLREMNKLIMDRMPFLNQLTAKQVANPMNPNLTVYQISGNIRAIQAILELSSLDFLKDDIAKIKTLSSITNSLIDPLILANDDYSNFISSFTIIKTKCQTAIEVISQAAPPQDPYTISVKFPPLDTLNDLSKNIQKLEVGINKIFSNKCIGGTAKISGFDSGSEWIDITIAATTTNAPSILDFAGNLIKASLETAKKIYEIKKFKQDSRRAINDSALSNDAAKTETTRILNQSLEQLCDIQIKDFTQRQAERLSGHSVVQNADPEFITDISFAIKNIGELIISGGEVHPSLNAPIEKVDLFPKSSEIKSIGEAMKLLSEGYEQLAQTTEQDASDSE